jgi:hypothetical protein
MVEQDVAQAMAKLKPLKAKEKDKPISKMSDAKAAIPCLVLVIGAILLLGMLFSAMLKSAS